MIGEPVSKEELEKLLNEEEFAVAKMKELKEELESIKPGGCMRYRTGIGEEHIVALSLIMHDVEGLSIIKRPREVYAYKGEGKKGDKGEDEKEGKKGDKK